MKIYSHNAQFVIVNDLSSLQMPKNLISLRIQDTIHFILSALCFQSAANRFKMLNGLKKVNWNQLKSIFIQLGFILFTNMYQICSMK